MIALIQSICSKFNNSSSLSALQPLHLDTVTEGSTLPYSRYTVLPNDIDVSYDSHFIEEQNHIQFDIWHTDSDALGAYLETLMGIFDNVSLALSPATGVETLINVRRLGNQMQYVGRDKNNNEVYKASVEYLFCVQRQS